MSTYDVAVEVCALSDVLVDDPDESLPGPLALPVDCDVVVEEADVSVVLLTGAVSPSALLDEKPLPAVPGALMAITRSVKWSLIEAIGDDNPVVLPELAELPGPVACPEEVLLEPLPDDELPDAVPERNVPLTIFSSPAFVCSELS